MEHSDSSGFCTYVKIIEGTKLWVVGTRKGHIKSSEDVYTWECAELGPRDQLLMSPGTPHFVITTNDCFTVGAHFYNICCMKHSLDAVVNEHFLGTEWTNDEYPTAPITLFKLMDDIRLQVLADKCGMYILHPRHLMSPTICILIHIPDEIDATDEEIAYLVVLVVHIDQLEPMRTESSVRERWVGTDNFIHDFKQIQWIAQELCGEMFRQNDEFKSILKECEGYLGNCIRTCQDLISKRRARFPEWAKFTLKSLSDLL